MSHNVSFKNSACDFALKRKITGEIFLSEIQKKCLEFLSIGVGNKCLFDFSPIAQFRIKNLRPDHELRIPKRISMQTKQKKNFGLDQNNSSISSKLETATKVNVSKGFSLSKSGRLRKKLE